MSSNKAANLAKFLLEINAVKLNPDNPFTWTSGIQSPIYCDNRMVLSFPHVRTFVKNALADLVKQEFSQADVIAGIATAGIAHAALVADVLEMPNCYVRPEPKKHGMKNQIEGNLPAGSKVVLVEDLISTGKSSLQAVQAVREAGSEVVGLVALFTYGFEDAANRFAEQNVPFFTISSFPVLAGVAVETGYLPQDKLETVKAFAANPAAWKP